MSEMLGPVELVVAAFKGVDKAKEALKEMKRLDREGVIAVLNAAVMVKKENGKVTIRETQDVDGVRGAIFGAITGGLVGLGHLLYFGLLSGFFLWMNELALRQSRM